MQRVAETSNDYSLEAILSMRWKLKYFLFFASELKYYYMWFF